MGVNDRVRRIEDREETRATIVDEDGDYFELAYDEGGTGWWPKDCVEPLEATP